MKLFSKYTCVTAFFCGHDHNGGYKTENDVHFLTFESPLECEVLTNVCVGGWRSVYECICMCVCMYIYARAHTQTYTHIQTHTGGERGVCPSTHTHTHTQVGSAAYGLAHTHTHIHTHTQVGSAAYGLVKVGHDFITVCGKGKTASRRLPVRKI